MKFFLLMVICLAVGDRATAQLSNQYKNYSQRYHKGMRYGLFKPDHYDSKKSYPLIVYLHGSTDTVSRDLIWYNPDIQKENPCFVLSPKTEEPNQGWGNTWSTQHTPPVGKTLFLIDSLSKVYNIDKSRLYIYGISMGGFGVFSLLAKNPDKFAGAYAVCGGSDVGAASGISTPLWIFHGADDDIVPVRLSKNVYEEMVRQGKNCVRYTEYPGVKHNSWENVLRERTLAFWLFAQQKGKQATAPGVVKDLSLTIQFNSAAKLQWKKPSDSDVIWYYKIFRDDELLAEVDGTLNEFNDYTYKHNKKPVYHVVAVNYLFKQSQASAKVVMEN